MDSPTRKKFFPVINCSHLGNLKCFDHALLNTDTAMKNGADGVFLSGSEVRSDTMRNIYGNVRRFFPKIWIGIDFTELGKKGREELLRLSENYGEVNAIRTTRPGRSRVELPPALEVFFDTELKHINRSSVDLKGTCRHYLNAKIRHPGTSSTLVISGTDAGTPPEPAKLQEAIEYLDGRFRLALTGNIFSSSVTKFLPYVDIVMTDAGLTIRKGRYHNLMDEWVREMAEVIHGY